MYSPNAALNAVSRVLKGWQEDADPAGEKRSWRWLLEADTDADGYDHGGEMEAAVGDGRGPSSNSSPISSPPLQLSQTSLDVIEHFLRRA